MPSFEPRRGPTRERIFKSPHSEGGGGSRHRRPISDVSLRSKNFSVERHRVLHSSWHNLVRRYRTKVARYNTLKNTGSHAASLHDVMKLNQDFGKLVKEGAEFAGRSEPRNWLQERRDLINAVFDAVTHKKIKITETQLDQLQFEHKLISSVLAPKSPKRR